MHVRQGGIFALVQAIEGQEVWAGGLAKGRTQAQAQHKHGHEHEGIRAEANGI